MLWGTWVIVAVTVLYLGASIVYTWDHQYGSALMFFAYSLANIGFFIQTGAFK